MKIAVLHVKLVQRQIFHFSQKKYENSSFCIQQNEDGSEMKVVCSSHVFLKRQCDSIKKICGAEQVRDDLQCSEEHSNSNS